MEQTEIKKVYNGKNIKFTAIDTVAVAPVTEDAAKIAEKLHIGITNIGIPGMLMGDMLYITELNGVKVDSRLPNDGIWVKKQNDSFQTFDNFCRGIEYIDKYATPTVREKCFGVLTDIRDKAFDIIRTSQRVAFFCEVGVWHNNGLVNKHLYNKDFRRYLYNVRWNYQLAE